MVRMRWLSGIVGAWVLLSFGLLPAQAHAQRSMNSRQMEALSPPAANRKVQGDLLSILKPVGKIDPGMFRWFHGIGLTTRPIRTEYKGVCRRDDVTLWYSPRTHSDEPGRETPLEAYAIEASPLFHIIDLPLKEPEEPTGELRWGPECDALDAEETGWFAAKDAYHAVQGALVFQRAIEAVRSGKLKAGPCPSVFDSEKVTCEQAIMAAADLSKIDSVETCPAEAGTICYVVELERSTRLTIKTRGNENDALPAEALSISIEQYLTVT